MRRRARGSVAAGLVGLVGLGALAGCAAPTAPESAGAGERASARASTSARASAGGEESEREWESEKAGAGASASASGGVGVGSAGGGGTAVAARAGVEPPAALIRGLATAPYVEERCVEEPSLGFAQAKRCSYGVLGLDAEVVVVDPPAERVARWIVDAAAYCAPLEALRVESPAAWERGLLAFGKHVRHQSSRIFPLSGAIVEDLGPGPKAFRFDRGVVTPCDEGNCRCRINSLAPSALCAFLGAHGGDEAACKTRYRGPSGDAAWRDACVENHRASLGRDENPHFRARAYLTGERVAARCKAPRKCSPDVVVALIEKDLGLK